MNPNPTSITKSYVSSSEKDAAETQIAIAESTLPLPSHAPHQVGRFVVEAFLGAGGFGEVYRARDPHLRRDVALKLANPETLSSRERVERFLREARAAADLQHPHIVPVFDAGEERGRYYIAAAFVHGRTLQAELKSGRPDFERAVRWVRQLAQALAYAHGRGIIHRDVKPANVMLNERDEPMLMDFGLALRLDDEHIRTQDGRILGTPRYMSPEQAGGDNSAIGPASDQYSLGVLLFEMLTGQPPFTGTVELILSRHCEADPPRPRTLDKRIPRDLETICLKCLEKDPAKRYADCTALAEDFRRYNDEEPIAARPIGVVERAAKWRRKNPLSAALAASVALVLVVGAAVAGFFAWQSNMNADKYREEAVASKRNEDRATSNFNLAKNNEKKAIEQAKIAEKRTEQLKAETRSVSRAAGFVADAAWEHGEVIKARELLDSVPEEFRQWEWRYRKRKIEGAYATLFGHTGSVRAVTFSLDGSRIATGSADSTVKVWDASTGELCLSFKGDTIGVNSVSFSSDGQRIVSGGWDRTVRVWDAKTGELALTLRGHGDVVHCAAFSSDNSRIVSSSGLTRAEACEVKMWDAWSGREIFTLKAHKDGVQCVSISPDRRLIASVGSDSMVRVWDAETGQPMRTLTGHKGPVMGVSFSPDSRRIVSGGYDKTVRVWDASSGDPLLTIGGHLAAVQSVSFSPDGRRIVSGTGDLGRFGEVKLWDSGTGQEVRSFQGHAGGVDCVSFSSDGRRIASGGQDKTVRIWDVSGDLDSSNLAGHTKAVNSASFSPDGRRIVSGSWDGQVIVWDSVTCQRELLLKGHSVGVKCVVFHADGRRIVSGGADKSVKVWDAATGENLLTLEGHTLGVASVSLSPDGRRIVSASDDFRKVGELKVWDAETGREFLPFVGHSGGFGSASYSPDGQRVVSGGNDAVVKVWDASTGREVRTFTGQKVAVGCLSFSPDNRRILLANVSLLKVLDASTGQELLALKGHSKGISSARYSPDGQRIVSGSWDRTVKVWDASTGQETLTLHGHTDGVLSVSFSPDGSRIVSSSQDKSVKVWDASANQEIATLRGHVSTVLCAAFSPDGTRLASGSLDQRVIVWDVATGQKILDLKGHNAGVTKISFSPDGNRIWSAENSGQMKAWDAGSGEELPAVGLPNKIWPKHERHPTQPLLALPDGNIIRIINVGPPSEHELRFRMGKARFDAAWHREQARRTDGGIEIAAIAEAFHRSQLALHEPADPRHWDDLQRACAKLGDDRLALQTADRVLAKSPDLDFVRRERARLRAKHLDFLGAAADWLTAFPRP